MKIHFLYHPVNKMKLTMLKVLKLKRVTSEKKKKAENAETKCYTM